MCGYCLCRTQRTRRSTPPRRAGADAKRAGAAAAAAAAAGAEAKAKPEPSQQQQTALETRHTTVKQGTLRKLGSDSVAEGGWRSLGNSELPRTPSDANLDTKKEDMGAWAPQHVEVELTRAVYGSPQSPRRQHTITAALHFSTPGYVVRQSAMGKVHLESNTEIRYTQGGSDFTVVSRMPARDPPAPTRAREAESAARRPPS